MQLSITSYPGHLTNVAYGSHRGAASLNDWYGYLLCFVLAGYATFGKGFAYIGIPPLFIGEITLSLGILVVIRSGCWVAMLASVPSVLLLALISLVILRAAPNFGTYGLDAARDSMVAVYGVFAFVVIVLLLERPERFTRAIALYSRFAWFYGLTGMALMSSSDVLGSLMPSWPISGVSIVYLRLGEGAVHLTGAAIFVLFGLRRVGPIWVIIMLVSIGMVALSRGALFSLLVPMTLAAMLGRHRKRFGFVVLLAGALFAVAYAADVNVQMPNGRIMGPEQIIHDMESVVGRSDAANLDGTKTWRLNWWHAIIGYTFNGRYFWVGKGFGPNLAVDDGFVVGSELGGPPVRSPHSVFMTMLARTGVPGLFLWIATGIAWFGMLFSTMIVARRRGDNSWADIFLWVACYGAAIITDAAFDVALEGPMIGIWFWCLFGLGIAATLIYRAAIETVQNLSPDRRQTP